METNRRWRSLGRMSKLGCVSYWRGKPPPGRTASTRTGAPRNPCVTRRCYNWTRKNSRAASDNRNGGTKLDARDTSGDSRSIRVVLADDHPVVRAGIKTMLEKEPGLHVVGEIAEGSQVEALTSQWRPHVLVLDVNMPGLDPVSAARRLKDNQPSLNILVLTAYDDDAYVRGMLSAGATGYLLKEEALDTLVTAIRAVARGESWLSQRVAGRLARRAVSPPRAGATEPLTAREGEVLRLLALGLGNDQIAETLSISKRTVQNHVSNIYGKLGLDSRAEAVLYAIRHGIVDVSEVKGP